MLEIFDFGREAAEAIAAAEAAFAETVATRPALVEAANATAFAYERAQHRYENFQVHVNRVTRQGVDHCAPALLAMIDTERGRRDAAGSAMTRARKELENCDWTIGLRRDDLEQLRLMVEPPKPPLIREVPKQPPARDTGGDIDPLVMPLGVGSKAAA
jgi:hypothetical protein